MAVAAASILVVEDEELVRNFLKRVLVPAGYDVIPVSNAREALTLLQSLTVDLVITDIRMPGMSGKQLGAEIERLPNAPPVMYVSASDTPPRGMENRYIQKPFKPAELIRAVRAVLDH
jgi:DNA-binding response OmpR family regulator